MESGSTRVTLLTFAAPADDGDAAPPHDHLVLVEDKWPILDWERGGLGQKKPYFDYPLLIVLSFPQNSSKTVRHSYQFETVPEPCMRAAKQLAVLVFWYLPGYYYRYSCTAVARSSRILQLTGTYR